MNQPFENPIARFLFPDSDTRKQLEIVTQVGSLIGALENIRASTDFSPEDIRGISLLAGSQFLDRHCGQGKLFPHVDEFEIEDGLSVKSETYDENARHGKINLVQVKAWIGNQIHQLGLDKQ